MNDRALREIVSSLGGPETGTLVKLDLTSR